MDIVKKEMASFVSYTTMRAIKGAKKKLKDINFFVREIVIKSALIIIWAPG